jgi:uncharacterized protein (TIGR01777 family)
MNIGITGASGFIGRRLVELAGEGGHRITGFSRGAERRIPGCAETRVFRPDQTPDISGCDVLIHLAGENVFGLWTREKKWRILESRQLGTRRLVDAILASANPPRALVSGSAIGFYGDTGEAAADETYPAGAGFLAETTQIWEREALRAREKNVRVVLLRTGIVLGKNGGALRVMAPLFSAGLGGKTGSGAQWMSWIHLDDIAALALFAAENESVEGPVNGVAPDPARNIDFTRHLAASLHRPAFFTAPAFLLKLFLGEFSRELLDSKRILPSRALAAGFHHRFPALDGALEDIFSIANQKSKI